MRIKSADLKNKFLFKSFAAFRASLVYGEAAECHMLLRMIGQIKVSSDRFICAFRDFKMWYGEVVVRRQIVKITSGDVMTRVPLRLSRRSLALY